LTGAYFDYAYRTLDDPCIYIVISNTGSTASDLIAIFTNGMNHEMLQYFNKKADASIVVYRLKCTREQKKMIIDNIKKINQDGNAYNLLGLVLKYSYKPNIMFCSQFVYKMLKDAGLQYFDKPDAEVKPMDLIELDYQRKLEYVYEIKFNDKHGKI
jgi:hypothetical protein